MIIDGHVHISTDDTHPKASITSLIKRMDETGTDKVIAFPLSLDEHANEELARMIAPYRNRIIPLAFINPHESNARAHLIKCLDDWDMKGLKLHPTYHQFHVDDLFLMDPLMSVCAERHLPVVIHCTSNDMHVHPYRIETLARAYPNALFQIAHMGAIWDGNEAIDVAGRNKNVYLDTGIASCSAVHRAMIQVKDKVIMGSDYPFHMLETEQLKIRCATEGLQDTIALKGAMGDNAQRLYQLKEEK